MLEFKLQQAEDDEDEESFQIHFEMRQKLVSFHAQTGIRFMKVQHRVIQNLIKKHSGSKQFTRKEKLKLVDASVTALFKEADVITDYLNNLMATSPPDNQSILQLYHNEVRITLENYLGDPNNEEDQRDASTDKFHRLYRQLVIKSEPYLEGKIPAFQSKKKRVAVSKTKTTSSSRRGSRSSSASASGRVGKRVKAESISSSEPAYEDDVDDLKKAKKIVNKMKGSKKKKKGDKKKKDKGKKQKKKSYKLNEEL
jgi:hypothetical protein